MSNPLVMNLKDKQSKVESQPNPFMVGPMGGFFKEQTDKRQAAETDAAKKRGEPLLTKAMAQLSGDFSGVPTSQAQPAPPSPSYEQLTAGQAQGPNVTTSTEALPEQDEEGRRRRGGGREQFAGGGAGIRVA